MTNAQIKIVLEKMNNHLDVLYARRRRFGAAAYAKDIDAIEQAIVVLDSRRSRETVHEPPPIDTYVEAYVQYGTWKTVHSSEVREHRYPYWRPPTPMPETKV